MKQRYRNEAGSAESKTVQLDNKVFDAVFTWDGRKYTTELKK